MRYIRLTKHSLNLCQTCRYTWYPKGKAVSMRCPCCGGRNVTIAPQAAPQGCAGCARGCALLVVALFVLSALSRRCSTSTPTPPSIVASPPVSTPQPFPPLPSYIGGPSVTPEVRRAIPVYRPPSLVLPPNSDTPPPITPPGYIVSGVALNDMLNVRSGPGSTYSVVARLPNGYGSIQLTGPSAMNGETEWVRISSGSNQSGWITRNFLKAN